MVFYSVVIMCTGENEENERRSSERSSETGGRQNNNFYHSFNLALVWSLHGLLNQLRIFKSVALHKVCVGSIQSENTSLAQTSKL